MGALSHVIGLNNFFLSFVLPDLRRNHVDEKLKNPLA
jgi:hypothetical protein